MATVRRSVGQRAPTAIPNTAVAGQDPGPKPTMPALLDPIVAMIPVIDISSGLHFSPVMGDAIDVLSGSRPRAASQVIRPRSSIAEPNPATSVQPSDDSGRFASAEEMMVALEHLVQRPHGPSVVVSRSASVAGSPTGSNVNSPRASGMAVNGPLQPLPLPLFLLQKELINPAQFVEQPYSGEHYARAVSGSSEQSLLRRPSAILGTNPLPMPAPKDVPQPLQLDPSLGIKMPSFSIIDRTAASKKQKQSRNSVVSPGSSFADGSISPVGSPSGYRTPSQTPYGSALNSPQLSPTSSMANLIAAMVVDISGVVTQAAGQGGVPGGYVLGSLPGHVGAAGGRKGGQKPTLEEIYAAMSAPQPNDQAQAAFNGIGGAAAAGSPRFSEGPTSARPKRSIIQRSPSVSIYKKPPEPEKPESSTQQDDDEMILIPQVQPKAVDLKRRPSIRRSKITAPSGRKKKVNPAQDEIDRLAALASLMQEFEEFDPDDLDDQLMRMMPKEPEKEEKSASTKSNWRKVGLKVGAKGSFVRPKNATGELLPPLSSEPKPTKKWKFSDTPVGHILQAAMWDHEDRSLDIKKLERVKSLGTHEGITRNWATPGFLDCAPRHLLLHDPLQPPDLSPLHSPIKQAALVSAVISRHQSPSPNTENSPPNSPFNRAGSRARQRPPRSPQENNRFSSNTINTTDAIYSQSSGGFGNSMSSSGVFSPKTSMLNLMNGSDLLGGMSSANMMMSSASDPESENLQQTKLQVEGDEYTNARQGYSRMATGERALSRRGLRRLKPSLVKHVKRGSGMTNSNNQHAHTVSAPALMTVNVAAELAATGESSFEVMMSPLAPKRKHGERSFLQGSIVPGDVFLRIAPARKGSMQTYSSAGLGVSSSLPPIESKDSAVKLPMAASLLRVVRVSEDAGGVWAYSLDDRYKEHVSNLLDTRQYLPMLRRAPQ